VKEENKKRRCFYILPSQDSDIYGGYVPSL